jgi:hypothetical protein
LINTHHVGFESYEREREREREISERATPIMLDSKNLRDTNTDRHREFLGKAQCKSSYELVCLLCLLIAESARGNVGIPYLLGK